MDRRTVTYGRNNPEYMVETSEYCAGDTGHLRDILTILNTKDKS